MTPIVSTMQHRPAAFFSTLRKEQIPRSLANQSHLLVLTHGHFDHVADAAAIIRRHGCKTAMHSETALMVRDREFFRNWGFGLEIEPFEADFLLAENEPTELLGASVQIYHVPGHCPGSLCFHLLDEKIIIGGDVLFREELGAGIFPAGIETCSWKAFGRSCFPSRTQSPYFPGTGRPPLSDGSGARIRFSRIEGIFARQRKPAILNFFPIFRS